MSQSGGKKNPYKNTPFSEKQVSLSAEVYKSVGSENETTLSSD